MNKIDFNGVGRVNIFKSSSDPELTYRYRINKKIENMIMLVAAGSGAGKTVLLESLAHTFKEHGYTVIFVTEKPEAELSNAYCCFMPTEKYQLDMLKRMEIEPKTHPIKIYHPMTMDIPFNRKLPSMKFFTYSLKNITERSWSIILSGDKDKSSVQVASDVCSTLNKDVGRLGFIHKLNDLIKKTKDTNSTIKYTISKEHDFLPISTKATETELRAIRQALQPFRKHCMLAEESSEYNLDFVEMLNDNEHIHFLTHKFIDNQKDNRAIFFSCLQFLQEIARAMGDSNVKHPVCLISEELTILLPKTDNVTYETELAEFTSNLLRTIRDMGNYGGSIIGSTQNLNMTNKKLLSSFVHKLLGKLDDADIGTLKRNHELSTDKLKTLHNINKFEFIFLDEVLSDNDPTYYWAYLPPFCIKEQGDDFFKRYKQEYPEQMLEYKDLKKELLDKQKIEEDKYREIAEKEVQRLMKEESEKATKKLEKTQDKDKKEVKKIADEIKVEKRESYIEGRFKAYTFRKENPTMGWKKIAAKADFKHELTAQKYALDYALNIKDWDFIKANYTKHYLSKKYPEIYTILYGNVANPAEIEKDSEAKTVAEIKNPVDEFMEN